jgi:hypothetical protein
MTNEEAMKELSYIADEMPSMECANWIEAINMGIKALEQTMWIPISERKPNLDDFSGSRAWQKKVLITGYFSFDDTKELFISEVFAEDVILDRVPNTVIVAWIPLPKLYIPEIDDKYSDIPVMIYPQVEGITPTVVEPGYNSIKTKQELSRDIEEIKEIVNCDADAEIKINMITNIIYSKPHYFKTLQQEEPCKSIRRQIEEEVLQIISDQINGDNKVEYDSENDTTNKVLSSDASTKKMGKWIVNPFGIYGNLICDNCFASAPYNYRTKYCPNCGLPKDTGDA